MRTDIFIRTYLGDAAWLPYCLRSISKYCSDFQDIIICVPEDHVPMFDTWGLTRERIVTSEMYHDDYIGQQVSKLMAFEHTNADAILFVDSDNVFVEAATPDSFLSIDQRIVLYKTPYDQVGEARRWKDITEKAIGYSVAFEYMRRFPLLYRRSTLVNLNAYMTARHGGIRTYALSQPYQQFSEFNLLGAYVDRHERDEYKIMDTTDVDLPAPKVRQFWSWGGITEEVAKEIDGYLK